MPSRESERTVTCRNSEFPTKFSSFKVDGKEEKEEKEERDWLYVEL